MPIQSAGILLYRVRPAGDQVFLIHMGGPILAKKDLAAWSVPKGVIRPGEEPLKAAVREFREETGFELSGYYQPLGTFRQNASKDLTVWALLGDCDPAKLVSNTFQLTWPPKSGKLKAFPEADQGAWFSQEDAPEKIVRGQRQVLQAFYSLRHKGRD